MTGRALLPLSVSERKLSRRGPKPKTTAEWKSTACDLKPVLRPDNKSGSQKQKVRVLVFLWNYRIPTTLTIRVLEDGGSRLQYQSRTQPEAADLFCIPQDTISDWVRRQEAIEKLGKCTNIRSLRTVEICC